MMELIVVRHAIACESDPGRWKIDCTRPLTAEGRRRFRRAAAGLGTLVGTPDLILTSPLLRAVETAEILEKSAGWPAATPCPELEPECALFQTLQRLRAERRGRVAVVGHEPHLGEFVGACIAGEDTQAGIEFKKGGVAILRFGRQLKFGGATLVALLPPRALRKARP